MGLGVNELLIVLGIVILLFGSTKIPQLMRSMGQGISEFKTGMKDKPVEDTDEEEEAKKA
ncbi:twin-arginine translocase TatA/TatE family subunit [Blastopirellula retiformator]|uniref:Sec-independent protein translocase protein TatA n=1 Tax=Blastopirellula retiformator TaxID=2527970 RepID=A0A5C5V6E7_9BACT|nr:twin-arginine translocase TatA/TatE family subunit [Blastopirellula retiformator]TWT34164.1 twin arginine translocase protein A [Blastopirellula retiformator]